MERWAANTLRTLGIILTAGFVLVVSFFLVLLSMCAAGGGFEGNRQPDQAVIYAMLAAVVVIGGVAFITWLARGIHRSSKMAPEVSASAVDGAAVPLHLSPLGRRSIGHLVTALAAQIVVGAVALVFNQIRFWSGPRIFAPFPQQRWMVLLLVPFALYHIPYGILIYVLLKRPDRHAFAYSLAAPAVFIMQALLTVGYLGLFLANRPIGFLLLFVPWLIHIVIIVLAYKAIQQVGIHPTPASLMVAAAVTLVYFLALHGATPVLYRMFAR